jgi:hypothetical protein
MQFRLELVLLRVLRETTALSETLLRSVVVVVRILVQMVVLVVQVVVVTEQLP